MRLLRYLLSHALLLLFIAALVLAYYYRAHLFSEDINARVDALVDKSLSWTEVFMNKKATTPPVEQAADTPAEIPPPAPEPSAVESAGSTVVPTMDTTSEISGSAPEPVVDQAVMPVPQAAPQTTVAPAEVALADAPATAMHEDGAASDQMAAASTHAELLNSARLAFQEGKPDEAIVLYQELSELNPEDPNIFGEMGNILYSQGKWQQAGVAYYEAANRLLAHGQTGQVQYLYRVIQGLDEESADKLGSQLGR